MKPVILLSFTLTLFSVTYANANDADVIRLSEPVSVTDTHEVFGTIPAEHSTTLSLTELVSNQDKYADQVVTIETEVAQVCQKKGCFFIARDDDAVARISFKDYGFFIPTDAGGKTVKLTGTFNRQAVSQEQADHYAADLGQETKPTPGFEYSIVATSVTIPKS